MKTIDRIEYLKETAKNSRLESPVGTPMVTVFRDDLYWLIEQAEQNEKITELLLKANKAYVENKDFEVNLNIRKALDALSV